MFIPQRIVDDILSDCIGYTKPVTVTRRNPLSVKNSLRFIGVDWGSWSGRNPEINDAMLQDVLKLIVAGKIALIPLRILAQA